MRQTKNEIWNKQGAAIIEYVTLLILIMLVIISMQNYIFRGISGRWKAAGDVFGQGRQYDPRPYGGHGEGGGTLECNYNAFNGTWGGGADCN